MQVILVDKLVKTQIVECQAVAKWVFSAEMASELTKYCFVMCLHLMLLFCFSLLTVLSVCTYVSNSNNNNITIIIIGGVLATEGC